MGGRRLFSGVGFHGVVGFDCVELVLVVGGSCAGFGRLEDGGKLVSEGFLCFGFEIHHMFGGCKGFVCEDR